MPICGDPSIRFGHIPIKNKGLCQGLAVQGAAGSTPSSIIEAKFKKCQLFNK
jgi:hypothetical protein